jgi:LysM repeat protein
MKNKRFFLYVLIAVLVAGLAACQMPASTPPPGAQTPAVTQDGFPRPGEVTDPMVELAVAATQTALAAQAGEPPDEASPEPVVTEAPPVATEPPVEQPEETQPPAPQPEPTEEVQVVEIPSPTPGVPNTYTLQKGEFPYCIARRYNVNPTELLALNGLSVNSRFYEGQTLRMPQTGNPWPGTRALRSHPADYTVGAGDTIYTIACEFGDVDPVYMAQVNGLEAPYTLTAGQRIRIP